MRRPTDRWEAPSFQWSSQLEMRCALLGPRLPVRKLWLTSAGQKTWKMFLWLSVSDYTSGTYRVTIKKNSPPWMFYCKFLTVMCMLPKCNYYFPFNTTKHKTIIIMSHINMYKHHKGHEILLFISGISIPSYVPEWTLWEMSRNLLNIRKQNYKQNCQSHRAGIHSIPIRTFVSIVLILRSICPVLSGTTQLISV